MAAMRGADLHHGRMMRLGMIVEIVDDDMRRQRRSEERQDENRRPDERTLHPRAENAEFDRMYSCAVHRNRKSRMDFSRNERP